MDVDREEDGGEGKEGNVMQNWDSSRIEEKVKDLQRSRSITRDTRDRLSRSTSRSKSMPRTLSKQMGPEDQRNKNSEDKFQGRAPDQTET
jgi:hypothetical protein